jgi:hypothetical protein
MNNNVSLLQVLVGIIGICIIIGLCGLIDGSMGGALFAVGMIVMAVIVIAISAFINHIKSQR